MTTRSVHAYNEGIEIGVEAINSTPKHDLWSVSFETKVCFGGDIEKWWKKLGWPSIILFHY